MSIKFLYFLEITEMYKFDNLKVILKWYCFILKTRLNQIKMSNFKIKPRALDITKHRVKKRIKIWWRIDR